MPDETLKTLLEVRCKCGGLVSCVEEVPAGHPGVVHTVPICREFDEREPEEFLAWLRGELEKDIN